MYQHQSRRLIKASFFTLLTIVVLGVAESAISQTKDQVASKSQGFASCRSLLVQKGVPFNPDDLLYRDWPEKLTEELNSMPEMKQVRRVTGPMQGVYIADTLYLPEHTTLTGITVIIAKYLVYDGNNPEVIGPYDSATFTVKPRIVLGTTLAEVLQRNADQPEIQQYAGSLPPFESIKKFVKIEPHTIGANASGSPGEKGKKGTDGIKGVNGKKGADGNQLF
jgi:hypothetical protein